MMEYLNSLTFNINSLVSVAITGFTIGVIVSTLLFIHLTSGIRATMTQTSRYRTMLLRDCDER